MKTLRVGRDGRGGPRLESLALPFLSPGPTATPQDRGLAPEPSTMTAVRRVRPATVPAGRIETVTGGGARRLLVVISGDLQVLVPAMRASLGPGDVLLLDVAEPLDAPVELRAGTPSAYLDVEVEEAWLPAGIVPPALEEGRRTARTAPRLLRMFSDGEVAHLAVFDELLAAAATDQDVTALSFVCLSPGMGSDWHTEPGVSLLVVLAGGFEVEVGGTGGRRTLRPGDVCLVEDFDGQGHKSSSDGETRFAVLSLPRDHAWPRTDAAEVVA